MDKILAGIVGGLIVVCIQLGYRYWLEDKPKKDLEKRQREMLKTLLEPENMPLNKKTGEKVEWRTFQTLMNVVGADEVTAKRLLIEIGARASTRSGRVWALEKNKPLNPSTPDDDKFETEET